jgi:predicted phosphodiesterase
MRIGILADIHEAVDALSLALEYLGQQGVDCLVVLGDVFDTGVRLGPTVALLQQAGVVGVWGNHDLGFCDQPGESLRKRYGPVVLDFMAKLRPRLELEECLFTHGLPFWDAFDPEIYYLGDEPESLAGQGNSFAATSQRLLFLGHFHRWLVASPRGVLSWTAQEPIRLPPEERFLVVVPAVCDGWCAIFDTTSHRLTPHRLPRSAVPGGPDRDGS